MECHLKPSRIQDIKRHNITNYFVLLPTPAGKGEQELMVAVRAAATGESLFQVVAFKHDRTIKSIVPYKPFIVPLLEMIEVSQE